MAEREETWRIGQRVRVTGDTWAAGERGTVDEHTHEDDRPLVGVRLYDGRHVLVKPDELEATDAT